MRGVLRAVKVQVSRRLWALPSALACLRTLEGEKYRTPFCCATELTIRKEGGSLFPEYLLEKAVS